MIKPIFTFIVLIMLAPSPVVGEIPENDSAGVIDPTSFERSKSVFEIGIIANSGTYYGSVEGKFVEKELPVPGGIGVVLMKSINPADKQKYYFVQGRGWEGWVDSRYFETTGMPLSGTINTAKLNVRSEPSAKSETLGQVVEDDRVFIYERTPKKETIGGDSGYWYRIGEGEWVFGAYVDLSPNYDLIWLFANHGKDSLEIAPEAVEAVVNGIINAPPRSFAFDLPPEYSDIAPNITTENATYQSQVLYWASRRLLKSPDKESLEWAAFYAEQLGEFYGDNNIYGWSSGQKYYTPAEAAWAQLYAYALLDDKKSFRELIMVVFPEYGAVELYVFGYDTSYGSLMVDLAKDWEPKGYSELLTELAEIAPNQTLKAETEFLAGEALVNSTDEADIARGQNILWAVIEEYPDEERLIHIMNYHFGQAALVEYVRSLPDDERRRAFLEKYTGDATPFPIRYCALYLLSYGDNSYDDITTFGPLDTGYRELYDSIQLEDKFYWFSDYLEFYGE